MAKNFFLIKGGKPLRGEVKISGYKNSAGAVLAASLLSEKASVIDNLPHCLDVLNLIEILKEMGAKVEWMGPKKVKINPKNINPNKIPSGLFEKMRVSVLLIGPLLTRFKKFKVPHPSGDKIGLRPISAHLEALKSFGVKVKQGNEFYYFKAPKEIKGKNIVLKEFSVTATENILMLAAKAKGKTKIEIAACEPQIQDLGKFLEKMGVGIKGIGTHTIEVEGKNKLQGAEFSISPDPTEAGTFVIAFAITGGEGKIKNVNPEHLSFFLEKMKEIGVNLEIKKNKILVKKSKKISPSKIQILPYPGFPTDLQPETSVLLTQAKGKSLIHDPLYESRFNHLHELRKMGADIEITDPHRALVFGKTKLIGNKINAPDIRAGAALILASLIAKGQSLIENVYQIDRGYEKLDEKLRKLGAEIKRV
ncbi:MAG: UDP-N-acetylglucosamine 1-carboxyvinyltransferase [Candidatus Nealsonbacteria bacterium]|nr:MAG: UDP-N-acetylglucosamine 1-carboxyvinyltransferase [Candidatus Nealsonbacteria bacterium]